jgi:hypothetical protein
MTARLHYMTARFRYMTARLRLMTGQTGLNHTNSMNTILMLVFDDRKHKRYVYDHTAKIRWMDGETVCKSPKTKIFFKVLAILNDTRTIRRKWKSEEDGRCQYQQLTPQNGLKMDENSLHPKFQESLTIGLNLKICHLNIDGISASKSDYLSHLMREHKIDIVAIQETHTTSDFNLRNRGKLPGFKLIGAIHSNVHGIATYVRDTLADCFCPAPRFVGGGCLFDKLRRWSVTDLEAWCFINIFSFHVIWINK